MVGHGGQLYVIGGRGSEGTVEKYDLASNTWTLLDIKVGCPDQEYSAVRRGFEGVLLGVYTSVDVTQSEGDLPDFNQSEH